MRTRHLRLEPKHYIYSHVFPDTDLSKSNSGKGLLYCDDAVQLRYYTSEHPKCPICLEEVVMPRLTPCGHMYCWRCLLQYLVMCPSPHKCPVCNALIYSPFTICDIYIQPPLRLGDEITMQLLKVPNGTTIPSVVPGETLRYPPSSKHPEARFSHVVVENDPLSVLAKESVKIMLEMKKPQDEEYGLYYTMMKEEINDLKKEWSQRLNKKEELIESEEWNYYYQDSLGRNIYLVPFNLSMLMENPKKITSFTSKVLQIEEEDVGLGDRKFGKSYQHIPKGTEIQLVEVELKGLVSNNVMSKYIQMITKRDNNRKRKIEEEIRQNEEERIKEEKRVAELKRMNEHFIFLEENYEENKEEIESKYFPSLGNNDQFVIKKVKKVKKQELFPSLGGGLTKSNQIEPKIIKEELTQSAPMQNSQGDIIESSFDIEMKQEKKKTTKAKKTKKTRRNKKILGEEFLGVIGKELPPQDEMLD